MESPHAGPGAFRVPGALSLLKGTFRNALSTTRNQHCHERAPLSSAGASHIRASASRAYRTFRQGDLECLMGGRAGSHGRPCARCLPVSWRAAGSCSSSAARRGAVLPSSATPAAAASSLVATAPAGTPPSPAVTKPATAAQTVTTAPSTQAQTTTAAASTQAQTTAAAQGTAPPAPARTTPAPPPAPPASTAPASCYPLSNEGTCLRAGRVLPQDRPRQNRGGGLTARRSSARTTMAGAGSLSDPGYVRASQAGCRGSSLWTMMSACSAGRAVSK